MLIKNCIKSFIKLSKSLRSYQYVPWRVLLLGGERLIPLCQYGNRLLSVRRTGWREPLRVGSHGAFVPQAASAVSIYSLYYIKNILYYYTKSLLY